MNIWSALSIVGGIIVATIALGAIWTRTRGRFKTTRAGLMPDAPAPLYRELRDDHRIGQSGAFVVFTNEWCTQCEPTVKFLQQVIADRPIDVVTVDLTHQLDLAKREGILSTPTTHIYNAVGHKLGEFVGIPRRETVRIALEQL